MLNQPIGYGEDLVAMRAESVSPKQVIVSQTILRDGDGIVLTADSSLIVEQGNVDGIEGPGIVCFFAKQHVVLAQFVCQSIGIFFRRFMPKTEMAAASEQIGTRNAAIVVEAGHDEMNPGIESNYITTKK